MNSLQFSNFQAPVFLTSLVILLVPEVSIILAKSTTLSKLSDVLFANFQVKLSENSEYRHL
jgi:hypothetical protein